MKLAQELIRFGQQLADERDAASDLWSWLPSHKVAQKHHGDYASEHCPSNQDVMHEAALYLAKVSHCNPELPAEEEEWFTRSPVRRGPRERQGVIMHCIDDQPNGIILNHNADWSGDVCIAWYIAGERPDSGRECWCVGPDLVAGRFRPTSGPSDEPPLFVPPVNVLTRAVALAVETYLRSTLMRAVDDLFIKRGAL